MFYLDSQQCNIEIIHILVLPAIFIIYFYIYYYIFIESFKIRFTQHIEMWAIINRRLINQLYLKDMYDYKRY